MSVDLDLDSDLDFVMQKIRDFGFGSKSYSIESGTFICNLVCR